MLGHLLDGVLGVDLDGAVVLVHEDLRLTNRCEVGGDGEMACK